MACSNACLLPFWDWMSASTVSAKAYSSDKMVLPGVAERISSIVIKYVIPEHDIGTENEPIFIEDVEITIRADYSYKTDTGDIPITLG